MRQGECCFSLCREMYMNRYPLTTLLLILFVCAPSTRAQSPELQQLKTKLDQLEQTMQDLKQQIQAAEAAQQAPGQPTAAKPSEPSQASKQPAAQLPVEHMGALTLKREVASENPTSAPRIN